MTSDTVTSSASNESAASRSAFQDIPMIDFGRFRTGNYAEKLEIGRQIDDALTHVGFFYVTNHGVSHSLMEDLFALAASFFELPDEEKLKVSIDNATNHRGYFAVGRENVDPTATIDLKEGFDIGNEIIADGTDDGAMRGANQWPAQPQALRSKMLSYYDSVHDFAKYLCRAMALALGLPEDAFDKAVEQPESRLRLLHYPPQDVSLGKNYVGAGSHTDCGCLTILAQDDVGGLEVQNQDGDWIAAPIIAGAFIVNVGDFMAYWSNNRYVSTRHKVVSNLTSDRYSIPLFLNPNFDIEVKGFESLIGAGEQKEKVSVSAYLRQCYDEIRTDQ